jgi:hypothetical protein
VTKKETKGEIDGMSLVKRKCRIRVKKKREEIEREKRNS